MDNIKSYKEVTERYCPSINGNAIIVKTVDSRGESISCLSSCDGCKECEHCKKEM